MFLCDCEAICTSGEATFLIILIYGVVVVVVVVVEFCGPKYVDFPNPNIM